MITSKDLRTLDVLSYMVEDMRPALVQHLNKERYKDLWLDDVEYTSERIKADLRKIRRLAMNISKHLD
ncbi:hypothetical protein [Allisonella histaminiformans]|uniref:hypothetical protein n=1 Tax=Allisonella histaminiformans TaxID=209880 RepID=UPI002943D999|nr:hypothetical protein [Allisonella histaminiformans]